MSAIGRRIESESSRLFDRSYGYVIYSAAMAAYAMQPPAPAGFGSTLYTDRGGFVRSFTRDHLNGQCAWSNRLGAKLYKDVSVASAEALLISEHEGVKGCVVLDARTLKRVDDGYSRRERRRSR